jgi:hypothetical protein
MEKIIDEKIPIEELVLQSPTCQKRASDASPVVNQSGARSKKPPGKKDSGTRRSLDL